VQTIFRRLSTDAEIVRSATDAVQLATYSSHAAQQAHPVAADFRAVCASRLRSRSVSLAVGAAYALALTAFAVQLGTWTDEEYTLATTAHGFIYAWNRAIAFELQAPLYFAVVAIWREANASVWFARLFSILCATGFFFAIMPLLRRVAPDKNPLWPALLIALNPFVMYCAFDIRLYAMALLVSTLDYAAFDAGFVRGTSKRARVVFVALGIVALYTQYFLGFAFVGYAVVLIVRRRFRALVPYTVALAVTGLASLPVLGMLRSQIGRSGETTESLAGLLRETLVHPWLEYVLPYDRSLDGLHLRAPYVALFCGLILVMVLARPRMNRELIGWLACAGTIEMVFVCLELLFRLDLGPRHYVVLFAPAMLAGYALIAGLAGGRSPYIAPLLFWTYAILSFGILYIQQHAIAQDGDTKRVAAFLQLHAARDATIAIFPADALPAYARQYGGTARLVPFPRALPTQRYDMDEIGVRDEPDARLGLTSIRSGKRLWLVMMGSCQSWSQQFGCNYVLDAVHDSRRIVSEHRFYDTLVYEIESK
jgi:hypothetical protein